MDDMNALYAAIAADGFSSEVLQMIYNLTCDIQYGRKDFNGFTLPEHAGLCKGDSPLIGASVIACYARRSLATGRNVEGCVYTSFLCVTGQEDRGKFEIQIFIDEQRNIRINNSLWKK